MRISSRSSSPVRLVLISAALLALAPACNQKDSPPSPPARTTEGAAHAASADPPAPAAERPAARPAAKLSDAQIAAIVVAANQVDIDAGQLAIAKAKDAEVKDFAQRMVTDHAAVNKAAVELVTKLGVTPEPSDASRALAAGGTEARAKLDQLEGDAFDRAYVDNEVAYHEAVIEVLDAQLIPSATNPELASALTGARPAFEAHLQHARHIQAKLAGGGAGAGAGHAHTP